MFGVEIIDTLDGTRATWQASTPDEINRLLPDSRKSTHLTIAMTAGKFGGLN